MRRLTGDVAVVVGAVVVLQEGDQSVQEVVRTQQNEFLQHICRNQNKEHKKLQSTFISHSDKEKHNTCISVNITGVGDCTKPLQTLDFFILDCKKWIIDVCVCYPGRRCGVRAGCKS